MRFVQWSFYVFLALALVGLPGVEQALAQEASSEIEEIRRAAEAGDAEAQFQLGMKYIRGEGVPKDEVEARKWLLRAAEQGEPSGQLGLALAYSQGWGAPQDYVKAHMWANLAASQSTGDDYAERIKFRDLVAEKMSAEQIGETQRLAREWTPNSEHSEP